MANEPNPSISPEMKAMIDAGYRFEFDKDRNIAAAQPGEHLNHEAVSALVTRAVKNQPPFHEMSLEEKIVAVEDEAGIPLGVLKQAIGLVRQAPVGTIVTDIFKLSPETPTPANKKAAAKSKSKSKAAKTAKKKAAKAGTSRGGGIVWTDEEIQKIVYDAKKLPKSMGVATKIVEAQKTALPPSRQRTTASINTWVYSTKMKRLRKLLQGVGK